MTALIVLGIAVGLCLLAIWLGGGSPIERFLDAFSDPFGD